MIALAAITIFARTENVVFAGTLLPQDGKVVAGRANITASGAGVVIDQMSPRSVVNWDAFSLGQDGTVTFNQPGGSSAILNRVTGTTPSSIAGRITGNGRVFLVNPNGIAITSSGTVQVGGGFVGSSLDIKTSDFMEGRLRFTGNGASAGVGNAGSIASAPGGMVGLIGGTVSNTGTITAPLGKVGIGSGEQITIDPSGDGFLQVAVPTGATAADGRPMVDIAGRIRAVGGRVEIKAATALQAEHDVVKISGSLSARSVSGHSGSIVLDGGAGGNVTVSGQVSTAGRRHADGGTLVVTGRAVTLSPTAKLDASGAVGGAILVGGDMRGGRDPSAKIRPGPVRNALRTTIEPGASIQAEGRSGPGGKVVVWSETETSFHGTIDATGGRQTSGGAVEVSSHGHLDFLGSVDVTSAGGRVGTLLLDPEDVTISTGADTNTSNASNTFSPTGASSILSVTTLQNALATANVTVNTGSAGSQNGDITVANAVTWSSGNALTLTAARDINVNANVTTNGGALTLNAGRALNVTGATLSTAGGSLYAIATPADSAAGITLLNATLSVGAGTGTLIGVSASGVGVSIAGATNLSATTGSLAIGGSAQSAAASMIIQPGAAITTAGTVSFAGNGGGGGGGGHGMVWGSGASLTSSGDVTLYGTASNHRVGMAFSDNTITATSGSVTILGQGSGTGYGINVNGGPLTLVNTGGGTFSAAGSSASNVGFTIQPGATIATAGNVSLSGTSSSNIGFYLSGANTLSLSGGNLSVSGTSTSSGGVWFNGGTTLANGGAGTLSITGVGDASYGLALNTGAVLTTSGNVSLSGSSSGGNGLMLAGSNSLTQTSGTLSLSGSTGATVGAAYAPNLYGTFFGAGVDVSVASGSFSAVGTASQNAAGLYVSGNLSLANNGSGSFALGGTSTGTGFSVALAGGTLTSTGTVGISSATTRLVFLNSPTVTVASGSLTLSGSNSDGSTAAISNKGAVTLNNTSGGTLTLSGTSTTNSGMEMQGGTSLTVNGIVTIDVTSTSGVGFKAFGSNALTLASGTLTINGTSTSGYGASFAGSNTLTNSGSGSLTLAGSSAAGFGLLLGSNASLTTSGTVALSGTSTGSGPQAAYLADSSSITDTAGHLTLTGTAAAGTGLWINNASTLTNSGSGTMTLSGSGTGSSYSVAGIWFNGGATTLTNSASGSLVVSGTGSGNGTGSSTAGAGLWFNGGLTAFVNSGGGTLSVNGSATASNGIGIQTTAGVTTAGSLTLSGTATNGMGVNLLGQLTDTGGNLVVTGQATSGIGALFQAGTSTAYTLTNSGSGSLNVGGITTGGASGAYGVEFTGLASGILSNSGSGSLTVSGTSASSEGLLLASGVSLGTAGAVALSGTSSAVNGILFSGGDTLTQASGALTMVGNTSSGSAFGLDLSSSGNTVFNNGTGLLALINTGGANIGATVTSASGDVAIAGTGAIIQSGGTITTGNLLLYGPGSFSLDQANAVGTIAAGVGSLSFNNSQSLTTGTVQGRAGIIATGAVTIRTTGDLTIASGATVSGTSPVVAAGAAFVNNAGSGAVSAISGRWLIYSSTPGADTFGSLDSGNTALWNATYGSVPPGSVTAPGNRYLFANQPTLTFLAADTSKGYGVDATAAVAASFSVSGYQTGVANAYRTDTATTAYAGAPSETSAGSVASAGVAQSPYAISLAPGSLTSAAGYAISITPSTSHITVNPASVVVTALGGSSVYGRTASNPGLSATGLQNGESVGVLTGVGNSFGIASTSHAGRYALDVVGTLTNGNYTIASTHAGTWVVNPATVDVTALSGASTYGAFPSDPGLSATGLQNGEGISALTGLRTTSFGILGTTPAGIHTLGVAGTLTNGNYVLGSTSGGSWTIRPALVDITALSGSSPYGASPSNPGLSATGLQNGDAVGALTGLSNAFGILGTTPLGTYSLAVAGALTNGNYIVVSTHTGRWTVNPSPASVRASLRSTSSPYLSVASPMTITFANPPCPSSNSDHAGSFSLAAVSVAQCGSK